MLPNKEFYLVMNDAGATCMFGDPNQDGDGRFPNRESATAAATANVGMDGEMLYVVHAVRTVVTTVSGTTQVTVTPV